MKANVKCMSCILSSREKAIQSLPDEELKSACMHEIPGVLYEYGQEKSSPYLAAKIHEVAGKYMPKERYKNLEITVILRGKDVINDATMEDAEEVGLTGLVTCIGNGSDMPGTVLEDFLCKCGLFTERFGLEKFSSVFMKE